MITQRNHKLVDETITYDATDNCGTPACSLTVASSDPVNGPGDGNTSSDWVVVDAHHVRLMAERTGNTSRTYTVTITCTDSAANRSSSPVTVTVQH